MQKKDQQQDQQSLKPLRSMFWSEYCSVSNFLVCSEKDMSESKMKPRLRAEELTGMISLLRDKFVRSENLRRCCFVPMRRNSVLDGLRSNLFKFIQERMSVKVVVSVSRHIEQNL